MAEPTTTTTSTGVVAVLIAALGPVAGPYSLIVMAALAGALWPLSSMDGTSRAQGALMLLRVVTTAVCVAGAAGWLVERWTGVPAYDALALASFAIGALGNGWRRIASGLGAGLAALARTLGGRQP